MEYRKPVMPSEEASQVVLFMGMERAMRRTHLGMDEALKGMCGTCDLMLSFLKNQPELGQRLAKAMGVELEAMKQRLEKVTDTKEPPPEPMEVKGLPPDAAKQLKEMSPGFSAPIRNAMQAARNEARENEQDRFSLGSLVFHVLMQDCEARTALLDVCSSAKLDSAAEDLRPATGETKDFMTEQTKNLGGFLDAMWPSIRAEASRRSRSLDDAREKAYADNPARYEKSLDLVEELRKPAPAGRDFALRIGSCLAAAENEARIRRAPEVRLDHLFYALLQPGTKTNELLTGLGIDVEKWRRDIDALLPRFEDGPRWPPNARDLGMNIPSGYESIMKKDLPDDLDVDKLTNEQRAEYMELRPIQRPFTDLVWLLGVARERESIGGKLLSGAGVTTDSLKTEIRAFETGDPHWHLARPDLPKLLQDVRSVGYFGCVEKKNAYIEAAQFEARRHRARVIEFEHFLLAMLIDGSDTAAFLDSLGVDRTSLYAELDATLPVFESGPYFPQTAPGLLFGEMLHTSETGVSDLQLLFDAFGKHRKPQGEPDSVGVVMLRKRGVTIDAIRARLTELGLPPMAFGGGDAGT